MVITNKHDLVFNNRCLLGIPRHRYRGWYVIVKLFFLFFLIAPNFNVHFRIRYLNTDKVTEMQFQVQLPTAVDQPNPKPRRTVDRRVPALYPTPVDLVTETLNFASAVPKMVDFSEEDTMVGSKVVYNQDSWEDFHILDMAVVTLFP